jgi:proteic killer suppression protein
MIKSFKCRKTERLFEGQHVAAFSGFKRQAEKRLRILDAADTLEALAALPSNRFERLSGDRAGQCSIRVNHNGVYVLRGTKVRMMWKLWIITKWI